jgi:predicted phosphodiesterase
MTILVIADDDTDLCSMDCGPVDVLISCGDLHDNAILRAVDHYRPRQTLAVRGNHDVDALFPKGVTNLHLSTFTFEGLRFGGFEGCWKYKQRGHHLYEQAEVSKLMSYFPKVDIFVAHNSPAGIHERDTEVHQGFRGFTDYLDRTKPTAFIHGHQHSDLVTFREETTILGVYGERLIRLLHAESQC